MVDKPSKEVFTNTERTVEGGSICVSRERMKSMTDWKRDFIEVKDTTSEKDAIMEIRADNLIPARLTALLFIIVTWLNGGNASRAFSIWRRDRGKTESPNAGQPMSAGAGALGVELEKVGHYKLGEEQSPPQANDIGRAVRLMRTTAFFAASLFMIISLLKRIFSKNRGVGCRGQAAPVHNTPLPPSFLADTSRRKKHA